MYNIEGFVSIFYKCVEIVKLTIHLLYGAECSVVTDWLREIDKFYVHKSEPYGWVCEKYFRSMI